MVQKAVKPKILLPRFYLSWSALDLWESSPERYMAHYFHGEGTGIENSGTRFGTKMDKQMEVGEAEDPIEDLLAKIVPRRFGKKKLRAFLPIPGHIITLEGELDDYDPTTHDFEERKTGKTKWTQSDANKHGQLKFYALMLWLLHKEIPKARLTWAETRDDGDEVVLTGEVLYFDVTFDLVDILSMAARVSKAAKGISEAYKREADVF